MSILINLFDISSLPIDELGKYPVWLIIYFCQVILPMIGLVVIALKIELKFGKEVRREIFGAWLWMWLNMREIAQFIVKVSKIIKDQIYKNLYTEGNCQVQFRQSFPIFDFGRETCCYIQQSRDQVSRMLLHTAI